jgi:hypothetical protein
VTNETGTASVSDFVYMYLLCVIVLVVAFCCLTKQDMVIIPPLFFKKWLTATLR